MKLNGKVAIVTGGGRGIGRETALLFAEHGAKVAVAARSAKEISDVAEEILRAGGEAVGISADVSREDEAQRIIDNTLGKFGQVDILVNNAGIVNAGPFATFETEKWREVIDVNLMGTFYCTRAAVPILLERGWGRIVNISSRSGKIGIPFLTAYCASKHGVVGLTKALAEELAPFNITVNAICPGTVETDMIPEAVKEKLSGVLIPPGHVADLALYLATEEAASINGEAINIYGRTKLDLNM